MKDRAIIFTSDRGYIVPTLVVVRQILDQPRLVAMADVIVFLIGVESSVVGHLREMFHDEGVTFVEMDAALFEFPDDTHLKAWAARIIAAADDFQRNKRPDPLGGFVLRQRALFPGALCGSIQVRSRSSVPDPVGRTPFLQDRAVR